jgi:hypothetical protein
MEKAMSSQMKRDSIVKQEYTKQSLTEAWEDIKIARESISEQVVSKEKKQYKQTSRPKDTVMPAFTALTGKDMAKGLYEDLTKAMISKATRPMNSSDLRAALENLSHSDSGSFRSYVSKFMGDSGLERYNKIIQKGGFDE